MLMTVTTTTATTTTTPHIGLIRSELKFVLTVFTAPMHGKPGRKGYI